MCRERAGGLPRTSNISSFVEPAKRKRKEKKKRRRRVDWKKKRKIYILEGNEMQMYSLVKSTGESVQKVSLHQRQVITYTHETPEFKVEVNYLARDLRLGRHLLSLTLTRGPRVYPSSFGISLIDDACIRHNACAVTRESLVSRRRNIDCSTCFDS